MYLHCKHGFIEADAWDGSEIPNLPEHTKVLAALSLNRPAIILRSRRRDTLHALLRALPRYKSALVTLPVIAVLESPPGWDYEYRAYVSVWEWGEVLTGVALGLNYRNFKHYTREHAPQEAQLAADIWHAAARTGKR